MPTTSNFGWTTPADTDLVKDGAAAIRTLGNGIDTSLVDLKGGTTGQILSKNSNTDLDYIWINNDQGDITAVTAGTGLTGGGTTGAVTLTNDMATTITAAGDIVVGTGSGTYDNLPIGTTGQVLTADTTVSPYKVKWAAAGGKVLQVVNATYSTQTSSTSATFADTGLTASITPSAASSKILVLVNIQGVSRNSTNSSGIHLKLLRGATTIQNMGDANGFSNSALWSFDSVGSTCLDSPNTTSSTTYKVQFAQIAPVAGTVYVQGLQSVSNSAESSITLMEIGA